MGQKTIRTNETVTVECLCPSVAVHDVVRPRPLPEPQSGGNGCGHHGEDQGRRVQSLRPRVGIRVRVSQETHTR